MANMKKLLCLCATLVAPPAFALDLDSIVSAEILPGWRQPDGTHVAALRIDLAPGWKTYWRAPGDAGIPPQIDLSGSEGIRSMQSYWPTPEVFETSGLRSVGYHDSVVVPIELTGDETMLLKGEAFIGVCDDICIPAVLSFEAELTSGGTRDGAIIASLMDQPITLNDQPVCKIAPLSDGLQVTFTMPPPVPQNADVVIEAQDGIWVSDPVTWQEGGTLMARSDMLGPDAGPFALDRSQVRVTLLGAGQATEMLGCVGG